MFILRKHYDEINKRVVELATAAKDLKIKNDMEIHNNMVLLEKNRKSTKFINAIIKIVEQNDYGNPYVVQRKIKDLVHDYQTKN